MKALNCFVVFLLLLFFSSQVFSKKRRTKTSCSRWLARSQALSLIHGKRSLDSSILLYLRKLHQCGHLKRQDRARILVYDYGNCKLVAIRQNLRTSAASLIKTYVMFAVYHDAYKRRIPANRFPARLQHQINRMMRVSSNSATNNLIRYLGKNNPQRGLKQINRLLRRYGLKDTKLLELIPRGGKTYRNYTTARDLSKMLYKIFRTHPISIEYSEKMLRVMAGSKDNRGKTSYLRKSFGMIAATKTGYTKMTNGVSGIVLEGAGMKSNTSYNFIAILSRPFTRGSEYRWRKTSTQIIQRISEMSFHYFRKGFANRDVKRWGGRRARGLCAR